jgi:hypothetical protein
MRVILDAFDSALPIGSILTDSVNRTWQITNQESLTGYSANEAFQERIREAGAVLFHIIPIGHNELPEIHCELRLLADGG